MIALFTVAVVFGAWPLVGDAERCAPAVEALAAEHVAGVELVARAWTCGRVARAAREQGVPVPLALSVAWSESRFAHSARSGAGAVGPMQVVPRWWCPGGGADGCDLVRAGVMALRVYLAQERGQLRPALCKYNRGGPCRPAAERYAEGVEARARRWGG